MVRARGVLLDRPSWLPAVALSSALALAFLAWDPHVRDLAAQTFRVELFQRSGLLVWNGAWYGGHYLLTYSLLFPPLAALFGARLVGAAAVVAGAFFFDRLVHERWGEKARPATLWYATGAVTMLASGRLAFALGAALALASLRALQQKRGWAACVAALASALASPVAGAFLAGIVVALVLARHVRPVHGLVGVAVASVVPIVALNVAFPDGGREPFSLSSFIAVPLWSAGALYVTRGMREERTFRAVVAMYLLACSLIWLFPNPLGGNVTRLGALFGGPMLAALALARRPHVPAVALVAVLAGSLYWQMQSAVRDVVDSFGDPATGSAYYQPLESWFHAHGGRHARIEVPPTLNHWEAAYLAPEFELARGWLRQLDRTRNNVFYEGRLTHSRYRSWLRRNGVQYVALADASPDYSAKAERRMIASHPRYLRLEATLEHWRVYRVMGTKPLLQSSGGARGSLVSIGPQSFSLRARTSGRFTVRVRSSPFWRLTAGHGCVGREGHWTMVRVDRPGTIQASIRFSLGRALGTSADGGRRC
jgi:hypothetical protein